MLNQMINKKYRLNPNSIIARGANRSMLCDLERSIYKLIPNAFAIILEDKSCTNISDVLNKYSKGEKGIEEAIFEYFEYLYENDLIFFTDFPEYYTDINLSWDRPSIIDNAIVDIDENSDYDFVRVFKEFSLLGCNNIQLRSYRSFGIDEMKNILESIDDTTIESIQFIIPFVSDEFSENIIELVDVYPRMRFVQMYGANDNVMLMADDEKSVTILTVKDTLKNHKCCGVISQNYFSVALSTFTESQHHNTCLNRKLSIDVSGNIKNCPSMSNSFGNIKNTNLRETLGHPDLKKYWNIKKDDIAKCQDCEFRHICIDCRAFIENPEDIYSAPLKCGYDPYTNKWEEWSENPLKEKTIQYYGMEGFLKIEMDTI